MKNISSETQEKIMGVISYGGACGGTTWRNDFSAPTLAAKTSSEGTATHIVSQTNNYLSGDTNSDSLYGHCATCHNYEDPYSSSDDGWTGDDYGSSGTSWSGESYDPGSC